MNKWLKIILSILTVLTVLNKLNKWLKKKELKKGIIALMKKRGMSITDIEIDEGSIDNPISYIQVDFKVVEPDVFFSKHIVINSKTYSSQDILRSIDWEIESFLKHKEIA